MAVATLGIIMASLIAAQTANSVVGDVKNAKAAKKLGAFQGDMYDEAARDAIARGEEGAHQLGAAGRALTGSQRAALAAQGIDVGSGSAMDVISSDERLNALDIMTVRNNAEKESHGLSEQAQLARLGGRNQAAAYRNQSYSTLLGGAGGMIDAYRRFGLNNSRYVPGSVASGAVDNSGGYGQR